jgi:hypothetical protein
MPLAPSLRQCAAVQPVALGRRVWNRRPLANSAQWSEPFDTRLPQRLAPGDGLVITHTPNQFARHLVQQ